jgi:hypothetical protein
MYASKMARIKRPRVFETAVVRGKWFLKVSDFIDR